jgi:hypothetical protein
MITWTLDLSAVRYNSWAFTFVSLDDSLRSRNRWYWLERLVRPSRLTGRIECLSLRHYLGRLAPLLGVIADRKEPANNWDQAGII